MHGVSRHAQRACKAGGTRAAGLVTALETSRMKKKRSTKKLMAKSKKLAAKQKEQAATNGVKPRFLAMELILKFYF